MGTECAFSSSWTAEVLAAPPLIAPARQFTWPRAISGEEDAMGRGALIVQVRPRNGASFLLTCFRGFQSSELPTGVWSCPDPDSICVVSGGYAYLGSVLAPEAVTLVEQRPVTAVRCSVEAGLLLFAGFHDIVAWGARGMAWRTRKITDEGMTLGVASGMELEGLAWEMRRDREVPFRVDLRTGEVSGGVQS